MQPFASRLGIEIWQDKVESFTEATELILGNDIALLAKATHLPSHAPKDELRKYFLFKSVIVIKIFNRYMIFATIYGYCKSCVRIQKLKCLTLLSYVSYNVLSTKRIAVF